MSWGTHVVLGMTIMTTVGMYSYVYMQAKWRNVPRTLLYKYAENVCVNWHNKEKKDNDHE